MAGFKEGVGFAYSKCRDCECNFEDMQQKFNEDLFVKRTMANHIRQCTDNEKASTHFLKEKPQWALKSSFKNICKSLVKHNQLYECSLNVHEKHPIFSSECEMVPVSEVKNINSVEGKIKDFFGMDEVEYVVSVPWIMLHGNKYICNKTLVIPNVIDNIPEFGIVKKKNIVNASVYCLECQPLSTGEWNAHYLAYEVEVPYLAQANVFVDAEKLIDYKAYYYLTFNKSKYVPVKYDLTDIIAYHSM